MRICGPFPPLHKVRAAEGANAGMLSLAQGDRDRASCSGLLKNALASKKIDGVTRRLCFGTSSRGYACRHEIKKVVKAIGPGSHKPVSPSRRAAL